MSWFDDDKSDTESDIPYYQKNDTIYPPSPFSSCTDSFASPPPIPALAAPNKPDHSTVPVPFPAHLDYSHFVTTVDNLLSNYPCRVDGVPADVFSAFCFFSNQQKFSYIQEISHHVPKKEIICVILYNCGIHPELNMVFLRRPSTGKRVPKPIFSSPTKAISLYQCGQGNMRLFTNRYLVGFYTLPVNFQELYWFSVLHPNCLNLLINNE